MIRYQTTQIIHLQHRLSWCPQQSFLQIYLQSRAQLGAPPGPTWCCSRRLGGCWGCSRRGPADTPSQTRSHTPRPRSPASQTWDWLLDCPVSIMSIEDSWDHSFCHNLRRIISKLMRITCLHQSQIRLSVISCLLLKRQASQIQEETTCLIV